MQLAMANGLTLERVHAWSKDGFGGKNVGPPNGTVQNQVLVNQFEKIPRGGIPDHCLKFTSKDGLTVSSDRIPRLVIVYRIHQNSAVFCSIETVEPGICLHKPTFCLVGFLDDKRLLLVAIVPDPKVLFRIGE
jgi:hypothetical protein